MRNHRIFITVIQEKIIITAIKNAKKAGRTGNNLTEFILFILKKFKILFKIKICPKCQKNLLYLYKTHYGVKDETSSNIPIVRTLQCKKCNEFYIQNWDYNLGKWVPDLIT